MVRSYCSKGLTTITLIVLISLTIGSALAFPVNETVKNFRIRFDAVDDTNMVAKYWSNGAEFLGITPSKSLIPTNELTNAIMVMAGNASDQYKRWGACFILILKNPENTSSIEKSMIENSTKKYVRVFDRVIDGHKALLLKGGNEPSDPLMEYAAVYWMDEVNGKAAKLVFIISSWPYKETERLLNTIHVEEVGRTN
jgi:hypothetical protein